MPKTEREQPKTQVETAGNKKTVLSIRHGKFIQELEHDVAANKYVLTVSNDLFTGGFDGGNEEAVIEFSDSTVVAQALQLLKTEGYAKIQCQARCTFDGSYWDHNYNIGGDDHDTHLSETRTITLELIMNDKVQVIQGWDKWFR